MLDASPADAVLGQEPEAGEGQEPDGDTDSDAQEAKGRTYTEAYVKQLRRDAAGWRNRAKELEEEKQEREDADKTEQERLTERVAAAEAAKQEAEAAKNDAETRLLRHEVAAERGLEPAWVQFITGSSREEIEHRAEELAKLLKDREPSRAAAGFDGGARRLAPEKGTPEEEHSKLLLQALGRAPRAS